MITRLHEEEILSGRKDLINSLCGLTLARLVRFIWLAPEEAKKEYGLQSKNLFSLSAGPLLMYFDSGLVVGFSSEPSRNSVVVWIEKNEAGESISELTEEDKELYPIDAGDNRYSNIFWARMIGERIKETKILKRRYNNALYQELANDVGLLIKMSNNSEFILSHGLHDNSDDFSVIMESQISTNIIQDLYQQGN